MYGAMIWVCFRRYLSKLSPPHQPLALTTSNGTPHNRYSSVEPIRRLCPWKCGSFFLFAASRMVSRNFFFMSGQWVRVKRYAKRCTSGGGSLIRKWLSSNARGSVCPSCVAHDTISPLRVVLVAGRANIVTLSLLRSSSSETPVRMMCNRASKLSRRGTVNSPSLAMV